MSVTCGAYFATTSSIITPAVRNYLWTKIHLNTATPNCLMPVKSFCTTGRWLASPLFSSRCMILVSSTNGLFTDDSIFRRHTTTCLTSVAICWKLVIFVCSAHARSPPGNRWRVPVEFIGSLGCDFIYLIADKLIEPSFSLIDSSCSCTSSMSLNFRVTNWWSSSGRTVFRYSLSASKSFDVDR